MSPFWSFPSVLTALRNTHIVSNMVLQVRQQSEGTPFERRIRYNRFHYCLVLLERRRLERLLKLIPVHRTKCQSVGRETCN